MNRLARMMALTLALLCLTVIGAGIAVAHLLPARLALFQMPRLSDARLARPGPSLPGVSGAPPSAGRGAATATGVSASIGGLIASGNLGAKTGRGFYDWSVKSADEVRACRDGFLIEVLRYRRSQTRPKK